MAVTTVAEFFAILEKSKLLNPGQLAEARSLAGENRDPIAVAKILAKKELISRWQAAQLLAGRGTFYLGKYRLIELLGRGGMGSVFLGQHVTMNRRVALKIISRQFGHDPASLERFLAEARAIASLDHPNIVQAYSVDNEGDRYYLVMEYVEGMDLQQLVETKGRLEWEQAVDFIRQAAEGLEHAHQRNMIHCDIKPSNLLINPQGVVKILDMGLAKLTDGNKKPSDGQDARVLGSVDYLSPEQALNSPDLDARADIYSLGCTFYFLLTGHAPFPEGTLPERILKHQTQMPKSILAERPDVPSELADLCMKMMAKQPADRCQTAAEVSLKLAEWLPSSSGRAYELPALSSGDDSSAGWSGPDFGKDPGQNLLDLLSSGMSLDGSPAGDAAQAAGNAAAGFAVLPLAQRSRSNSLFATPQQTILICGAAAAVVIVVVGLILLMVGPSGKSGDTEESRRADNSNLSATRTTSDSTTTAKAEPPKPTVASGAAAATPPTQMEPPKVQSQAPKPEAKQADNASQTAKPAPEPPKAMTQQAATPAGPPQTPPEPPKVAEAAKTAQTTPTPHAEQPKEPTKEEQPQWTLADAIDLPSLENAERNRETVTPLGKTPLPPGKSLDVSLVGGQEAFGSDRTDRFVLNREEPQNTVPSWIIRFIPKSTSRSEQDVARILLDQQALGIGWIAPTTASIANPLRNCALNVSAGDRNQSVNLCRPQTVEPILFVLDAEVLANTLSWERTLSCDFVSDEMARLQITELSGPFSEFQIKSETEMASSGESIEAAPTDAKLPPVLLRIDFKVKPPFVTVDAAMLWQGPNRTTLAPIRPKDVQDQTNRWIKKRTRAAALPLASQKQAVKEADTWLAQLKALNSLCDAANNTAKIHFRVFHEVGDRQVNLFVTPPPSKNEPPAQGKPVAEKDNPPKTDKKP